MSLAELSWRDLTIEMTISPLTRLRWSLAEHARGKECQRWFGRLEYLAKTGDENFEPNIPALKRLLLVETHERRRVERGVEWLLSTLLLRQSITRGPYQLTNAPWSFVAATRLAVERLEDFAKSGEALDNARLSVLWYGAEQRQPGSAVSYADALTLAEEVLLQLTSPTGRGRR